MIESTELRLGNFVRAAGTICTVTAINGSRVETSPQIEPTGQPEGIPLDTEWMNHFTGDDSGNLVISTLERTSTSSDMIILSTIECYLHDDGFLRVCAYEYEKQQDGSSDISDDVITLGYDHIRYVHQLQNLYFSLAGKELKPNTIDLPV